MPTSLDEELASRPEASPEQDDSGGASSKNGRKIIRQLAAGNLKKQLGRQAKRVVVGWFLSALSAIGSFILSTFPIWGPILLVIILVVPVLYYGCKYTFSGYLVGMHDVCEAFDVEQVDFGGSGSFGGGGAGGTFGGMAHTDALNFLQRNAPGVTLRSSGFCSDKNNPTCTSLDGISQSTLDEIVSLKQGCDSWAAARGPCSVVVTGGTEVGHASGFCSHESGRKFDVGVNTLLNQYIGTFTSRAPRGANLHYLNPTGTADYYLEPTHWDVAVGCTSSAE